MMVRSTGKWYYFRCWLALSGLLYGVSLHAQAVPVRFDGVADKHWVVEPQAPPASSFLFRDNIYFSYGGRQAQYTCLTPAGQLFALPRDAVAAFYPRSGPWPAGCLAGFKWRGVTYYGWWRPSQHGQPFLGYAPKVSGERGITYGPFLLSRTPNPDSVYAAVVSPNDSCRIHIKRGAVRAEPYTFTPYRPVQTQLNVSPLFTIQLDRYLTPDCLGGQQAWCAQRYAGHPYLAATDHSPLARIVKANPCLIGELQHYDFSPDDIDSPWMEELKNISAAGLAVGFLPVVMETTLSQLLREFGKERVQQAAAGYTLDLLLQACIRYYFPPGGGEITWAQAFQHLDQFQASASAMEAMIALNNTWLNLALASASSCLVDGMTQHGSLRSEFSAKHCAIGAGSAMLVSGAIGSFPRFKTQLQSLPKTQLIRGIIRLLGDYDPNLQLNGLLNLPEGARYAIYKVFQAGEQLDGQDVEALFNIGGTSAPALARSINANADLQAELLATDFWLYLRQQTGSPAIRAELLEDLTKDITLVRAMRQRPELVGAWEFVAECPQDVRANLVTLNGLAQAVARGVKSINDVVSYASHPAITKETVVHVFRGDSQGGRHHISSILEDNVRKLTNRLKETEEGFYGAIFSTSGKKSFWPDTWDEFRVVDELKYVLDNSPTNILNTNVWRGKTQDGQLIEYYMHADGYIISAFPVLPNFP